MKVDRYCFLILVLIALVALGNLLSAQQIDERVWSMSYWQKLAEKGLVPVAKQTTVPDAVYTGSKIIARTVLVDDSPDVPVINATNTTQSENSIFVNPLDNNKALNSNNSTPFPVAGIYGSSGFMTDDFGLTWGGAVQGTGGSNSGDPAACIDLNGRYYVGYIAANSGQGVAYSTNEGQTWTHVQCGPGGYILDKNHLWVDNSPTSPYSGNLYSAWTNFQGGANDSEIEIVGSTDGGLTWSTPLNISSAVNAGSHNQGVNISTGPNGEVYVTWTIYDGFPTDETALGFAKSTDGGVTFQPATRIISNIRGIRNSGTSKNHRVNSFPSMDTDISGGARNGWIYVVWANIGVPGSNVGPDIDNYIIRSTNGGASWSTPVKINQDSSGLGKEHYFPWIACDPLTGNLSVVFYDDRNVSSTMCEVFVANSLDGGTTWEDFKVSDVAFTPAPIPGLAGGYMGDYLGISARGGKVYPVWTDNRTGRALAYVSPFILDATYPNPPEDLSAYSDYSMANSMHLEWTNPTLLLNGDPLTPDAFSIVIYRGEVYVDSIPGTNTDYTDTGLNDGEEYTYEIYAVVDTTGKASSSISASWIAGGSPIPNPPTDIGISQSQNQVTLRWRNPSTNIDGTPMDDLGGVYVYQGSDSTIYSRSPGDSARMDSVTFTPSPGSSPEWYLRAFDNESPTHKSVATATVILPLNVPVLDNFNISGLPNPGHWQNWHADVNDRGLNVPSEPYSLNFNGMPVGGDTVISYPIDLHNAQGSGMVFSYFYQPQGSGNAPEPADSLRVYFKNDLGEWVFVRGYPGSLLQDFQQEIIDLDTAPNGGGSYFHSQFQIRIKNRGSANPTTPNDDWFVDNTYLGLPAPAIAASQDSVLFDTTAVGDTSSIEIQIHNVGVQPLVVSQVLGSGGIFSADVSSFTVDVGSGQAVNIRFSPQTQGNFSGSIRFVSNDPVNDTLSVYVAGTGEQVTGIADVEGLPRTFAVSPNYPNPFNPTTTIKYQLPQTSDVKLVIYNVLGQAVRTLVNARIDAGYHSAEWNGRNDAGAQVASGIYIYRFQASDFLKVQKMILMK